MLKLANFTIKPSLENPLLNETDLYDTDDPVLKRIPQQYSQTSHELHTLFTEVQH